MSPELLKVAERARREPEARFHSLAHLMDVAALGRSFDRLRPGAAVGVDGMTKEMYAQGLESRLDDLHRRLRQKRYRHQPVRRVHIPKGQGKTRPLGVSTVEDKLVQGALRELLEAVYEQTFLDCSYGFRPGRSAHDAIRALDRQACTGRVRWVLEADIESFFDSMDHRMLQEMLQRRVPDGSLRRLIGKCLKAGVLDGEELSSPEQGAPQGSVISPLLANVYLHYVLDEWMATEVKPRMRGQVHLIRYADDFVICFERRDDAERVLAVLGKRMGRFGLRLHPERTRLVCMERPSPRQQSGKGPGSFDFLGFTAYWRRSYKGHRWVWAFKTSAKRLHRAMDGIAAYCRSQRHRPLREQHAGLVRRLRGWFNYYGVNGNCRGLARLSAHARRVWHKWLNRRSQRSRLHWERFNDLLTTFPLPPVRVYQRIWR